MFSTFLDNNNFTKHISSDNKTRLRLHKLHFDKNRNSNDDFCIEKYCTFFKRNHPHQGLLFLNILATLVMGNCT